MRRGSQTAYPAGKGRIGGILLAVAWLWAGAAYGEPTQAQSRTPAASYQTLPLSDDKISNERDRAELSDMAGLMDRLKIRPGMTILDLGAGSGPFSYLFAERMKGRGRVFATDCMEDMVAYVSREAQRRGLGNISAVLVKCDGVDGFYSRHAFDVIFLAHVYRQLSRRVEFMRALRDSLSDQGRLVIANFSQSPYSEEVQDPEGFVRKLSALPEQDFCRLVLSSETLTALQDPRADARRTAAGAVRDFNETGAVLARLGEPESLLSQIPSGRKRRFAQWLLDRARIQPETRQHCLSRFATLIFDAKFAGHLAVSLDQSLERIKQELAEAGYRFEGCNPDFAPTEFAAIFSKDK